MSNVVVKESTAQAGEHVIHDYLIFQLGGQAFCIHVGQVRDVLRTQKLTHVPLSASAIAGVMNLRGHIVTAVDARIALAIEPADAKGHEMNIVVEFRDNLYSIIVDSVRDVITFHASEMDTNPSILEGKLRDISNGVIKRDDELIICLDVARLFATVKVPQGEEI